MLTPFVIITLFSLVISFIISVLYRLLTNPDEVRKCKEDMKFYKEKSKEAQKEGDREKVADYSSEMLKASQKQFRMSMRPMLASMMLFFLLLGWLHGSFSNLIVDFSGQQNARAVFYGEEHEVRYDPGGETFSVSVDLNDDGGFADDEVFGAGDVFSTGDGTAYWSASKSISGFLFFTQEQENQVTFSMMIAKLPFAMPLLGSYLTWFWWYIFISIPATIIFRKLLGVE
jgi:uncharacterized membrane protein (DUF106 family)